MVLITTWIVFISKCYVHVSKYYPAGFLPSVGGEQLGPSSMASLIIRILRITWHIMVYIGLRTILSDLTLIAACG